MELAIADRTTSIDFLTKDNYMVLLSYYHIPSDLANGRGKTLQLSI